MPGLVLELQSDALNRNVSCSDLLRKALVVSRKLGVGEVETWLRHELNGYPQNDNAIPNYRKIHGLIKVWNPYHGWQPLNFRDPKHAELLTNRDVIHPIGELDALLENKDTNGFQMPFSQSVVNSLMKGMEVRLQPTLHVPHTEIVGILDAVRNSILEWALELERNGVVSEGMTFSSDEKKAANQVTNHITYNISNMHNSQIQQNSPGAFQNLHVGLDLSKIDDILDKIKKSIGQFELDSDSENELLTEVSTIEIQSKSLKPKKAIIVESLKSIRSVLESATGSIAVAPFLAQIGSLL